MFWQILSLVCPPKYYMTLRLCAKMVDMMNKVFFQKTVLEGMKKNPPDIS